MTSSSFHFANFPRCRHGDADRVSDQRPMARKQHFIHSWTIRPTAETSEIQSITAVNGDFLFIVRMVFERDSEAINSRGNDVFPAKSRCLFVFLSVSLAFGSDVAHLSHKSKWIFIHMSNKKPDGKSNKYEKPLKLITFECLASVLGAT